MESSLLTTKLFIPPSRPGLVARPRLLERLREAIRKEQAELENRKIELERQLTQRSLTEHQEAQIRALLEKISTGLDCLDFTGKQDLLRLLVEKVLYNGQEVEIQTIIPQREQLHPIQRGGLRG